MRVCVVTFTAILVQYFGVLWCIFLFEKVTCQDVAGQVLDRNTGTHGGRWCPLDDRDRAAKRALGVQREEHDGGTQRLAERVALKMLLLWWGSHVSSSAKSKPQVLHIIKASRTL